MREINLASLGYLIDPVEEKGRLRHGRTPANPVEEKSKGFVTEGPLVDPVEEKKEGTRRERALASSVEDIIEYESITSVFEEDSVGADYSSRTRSSFSKGDAGTGEDNLNIQFEPTYVEILEMADDITGHEGNYWQEYSGKEEEGLEKILAVQEGIESLGEPDDWIYREAIDGVKEYTYDLIERYFEERIKEEYSEIPDSKNFDELPADAVLGYIRELRDHTVEFEAFMRLQKRSVSFEKGIHEVNLSIEELIPES
jgi:hypothetical protein